MISGLHAKRRQWISSAVGLLAGGVAFWLTLLDYGTDLTRTALAPGYFSQFFDLQARALLDGHLDVPAGSLGIEGFVHDGRTYTYFPPFPALLRLPVLLTTHEYDFRLTLLSMALAWVVLAVMATKLIWLILPLVTGVTTVSWQRGALAAVFLAAATGGTFLTYDASLPWVYHEVYVWAVTAAVGGLYWMVRLLTDRDPHSIKWLFIFGLVAVGTRATEGWAICLVVLAIALWWRFARSTPESSRALWWRVLLAGAVPLAASIALNLYKFDEIYMFPLQDQVWTQISEQRRLALAANGGTLSGPQFFTTSFMAYLRPDGIRFVDYFPWITLPAAPAPAFQGAVVDQTYRTGSATAFMPMFMVLEVVAVLAAFRPRARRELRLLRWPVVSSILITGGVMGYGYYSNRYTSEFVPALVLGGAIGTSLVSRWLDEHRRWRVPVVGLMAAAAVFSLVANMATGLAAAAINHRGEPLERLVAWQLRASPEQQAGLVHRIDGLPSGGHTDDLAVRGDCDALYLNTGDLYEPWLPVQERDRVLRLRYRPGHLEQGDATVLTVSTTRKDRVDVQVNVRGQVRFLVFLDGQVTNTQWSDPPTDRDITLGIRNRIDFGVYELGSTPGGVAGYLPSIYLNDLEDSLPADLRVSDDTEALGALGFTMTEQPGLPLPLCTAVVTNAGLDSPRS